MEASEPLACMFFFLLNQPRLFEAMAEFTGCATPILYFEGRSFKLLPGGGHFDSWHSDSDRARKRLYGLSINLSREPFEGGNFRIRNRKTGEVLRAVTTSRFGDACLFRIHDSLEHKVSAVRGEAPRCCYAGWFTGTRDYREVLREAASPYDTPGRTDAGSLHLPVERHSHHGRWRAEYHSTPRRPPSNDPGRGHEDESVGPAPKFALSYDSRTFGQPAYITGRKSAIGGFLRAILRHSSPEDFVLAVPEMEDARAFFKEASTLGFEDYPVPVLHTTDLHGLAATGVVFYPGPDINGLVCRRRLSNEAAFSVAGVAHALSGRQVYRHLCNFILDPFQSWDALICPSRSAKSAIEDIFEHYREYLARRNITAPPPPLRLPIIPLGVHCDRFARTNDRNSMGRRWRRQRGIRERDVVLLNFGRLDPSTKMHPIPLFLAVEQAQRELGDEYRLHLLMARQRSDSGIVEDVMETAEEQAPSFRVHWIDGDDRDDAGNAWAAADVFVSLTDNVQESFGLTPLEAMAASLPCIVSDWNGYRDTVVHEETGIRVRTRTPSPDHGIGVHFSDRHAAGIDTYPQYVGGLAQLTSVDVAGTVSAIVRLTRNPGQRRQMGERGRRRAEDIYDWKHILARYLDLFEELNHRRNAESVLGARDSTTEPAYPRWPDPFRVFSAYPSRMVSARTRVRLARDDASVEYLKFARNRLTRFPDHATVDTSSMARIIDTLEDRPTTVDQLCLDMPELDENRIVASCLWLAKYGLLSLE